MELTFILTEACNLRCTYCYQPAYPETRMAPEIALSAMKQAIANGAQDLALTFFGGEPLLQNANYPAKNAAGATDYPVYRRSGWKTLCAEERHLICTDL